MPLEHRRSKDIQPENTSPQPSDPIREKDREQTLIPNEKEAIYRVNSYDRKITKVGEYARSKLTSEEIDELTSYNRKNDAMREIRVIIKKYIKREVMANNKFQRYRYEFQKIHGNAVKQEKSRGESFLEGLSESDKQAVLELANFCNKYGLKKTEEMFNLGHEIH